MCLDKLGKLQHRAGKGGELSPQIVEQKLKLGDDLEQQKSRNDQGEEQYPQRIGQCSAGLMS